MTSATNFGVKNRRVVTLPVTVTRASRLMILRPETQLPPNQILRRRRARESNPQPVSRHDISSVAASHSLTLRKAADPRIGAIGNCSIGEPFAKSGQEASGVGEFPLCLFQQTVHNVRRRLKIMHCCHGGRGAIAGRSVRRAGVPRISINSSTAKTA